MDAIFKYVENDGVYVASINEIIFEAETLDDEVAQYAHTLANNYANEINNIVEYMIEDEDFTDFYEEETKESIIAKLGKPKIRLLSDNDGIIEYLNHKLDNTHIISLEFSGVFEDFDYLSIDG